MIAVLNTMLANFYERDIRKLIDEVNAFSNEEHLWQIEGSVKNSCGNLVLHIIGGLNFLIGTNLAHTGYVRNRDQEFIQKGSKRNDLVAQLEALIPMITGTLKALTRERMEEEYPMMFDDVKRPNSYVLLHLSLHLNYHLGPVNYLRRILE
jgi:hypothetical protein